MKHLDSAPNPDAGRTNRNPNADCYQYLDSAAYTNPYSDLDARWPNSDSNPNFNTHSGGANSYPNTDSDWRRRDYPAQSGFDGDCARRGTP